MTVLKMMVELYVTICGFAFASSCLELYKVAHKKKLQKSKALRRKVLEEKSDEKEKKERRKRRKRKINRQTKNRERLYYSLTRVMQVIMYM